MDNCVSPGSKIVDNPSDRTNRGYAAGPAEPPILTE